VQTNQLRYPKPNARRVSTRRIILANRILMFFLNSLMSKRMSGRRCLGEQPDEEENDNDDGGDG